MSIPLRGLVGLLWCYVLILHLRIMGLSSGGALSLNSEMLTVVRSEMVHFLTGDGKDRFLGMLVVVLLAAAQANTKKDLR